METSSRPARRASRAHFEFKRRGSLANHCASARTAGSPAALKVRRQLDAIKPGDLENVLGMVEDCLKAGDSAAAEEQLKALKPADRTGARYHSLAAGVALSRVRCPGPLNPIYPRQLRWTRTKTTTV